MPLLFRVIMPKLGVEDLEALPGQFTTPRFFFVGREPTAVNLGWTLLGGKKQKRYGFVQAVFCFNTGKRLYQRMGLQIAHTGFTSVLCTLTKPLKYCCRLIPVPLFYNRAEGHRTKRVHLFLCFPRGNCELRIQCTPHDACIVHDPKRSSINQPWYSAIAKRATKILCHPTKTNAPLFCFILSLNKINFPRSHQSSQARRTCAVVS